MRQVLALAAGTLLAALGAVVLGEYPLDGTTALVGFPLYGVAVSELALAVGKRLAVVTLAAVGAVVALGLTWALWISFGHFRNDVHPPVLSWVMVAVAVAVALIWGWPRRRRTGAEDGPAPAGAGAGPPAAGTGHPGVPGAFRGDAPTGREEAVAPRPGSSAPPGSSGAPDPSSAPGTSDTSTTSTTSEKEVRP